MHIRYTCSKYFLQVFTLAFAGSLYLHLFIVINSQIIIDVGYKTNVILLYSGKIRGWTTAAFAQWFWHGSDPKIVLGMIVCPITLVVGNYVHNT